MCVPGMGQKPLAISDSDLASYQKTGKSAATNSPQGGQIDAIYKKAKLPDYVKDGATSKGVSYYNTDGTLAYRNNAGGFIPRSGEFVSAVGPAMMQPGKYDGNYAAVEKAVAKEKADWEKFMGINQPVAKPNASTQPTQAGGASAPKTIVQAAPPAPGMIQAGSDPAKRKRSRTNTTAGVATSTTALIDGGTPNMGAKTLFGQ